MPRLSNGLYFVTDRGLSKGRVLESVSSVLKGGAVTIQYREKNLPYSRMLEEAQAIRDLCNEFHATFLVNDYLKLALEVNADGLHVGQHDLSLTKAHEALGTEKLLGISISSLDHLPGSELADHLSWSPVFSTSTKPDAAPPLGLAGLSELRVLTSKPLVAIGGITLENAPSVLEAGADSLAVISSILNAPDWEIAARKFTTFFD
ncbi:thiamine phosphate synthase [Candidatus Micrarchaeota archaeon]|nr:thiamine phosphate synthase [Candidatus Micrarchaeota archaeon]